jgi:hypothetical protein
MHIGKYRLQDLAETSRIDRSHLMKIAYAASEITPYASTGGLAEVAAALPVALCALGHEVVRFMPMYRSVMEGHSGLSKPAGITLSIPVGFHSHTADVWYSEERRRPDYLLYPARRVSLTASCLYSLPDRDYDDNFERFVFFQKAVVALLDNLKLAPDVVHGNDWQCGLLPFFLVRGLAGPSTRASGALCLHHPQPGLPGHLSRQRLRGDQSALPLLLGGHGGILRQDQLPEGWGDRARARSPRSAPRTPEGNVL